MTNSNPTVAINPGFSFSADATYTATSANHITLHSGSVRVAEKGLVVTAEGSSVVVLAARDATAVAVDSAVAITQEVEGTVVVNTVGATVKPFVAKGASRHNSSGCNDKPRGMNF